MDRYLEVIFFPFLFYSVMILYWAPYSFPVIAGVLVWWLVFSYGYGRFKQTMIGIGINGNPMHKVPRIIRVQSCLHYSKSISYAR
jgi:hypothetical protein